jgi:outer membrane immunogenic protein
MNRTFSSIAVAFGAVLIVVPAIADEAPPSKPVRHVQRAAAPVRQAPVAQAPVQSQPSWTGSQVGGQGGVSQVAQGFAEPGAYLFPFTCFGSECVETPFSFNGDKTAITGGGFLGYRIQFGSYVVGAEGDINAKTASASLSYGDHNLYRTETFYGTARQGWDASIRGRLGYLVTPWTMVYGTGGVAFGNVSGSFAYNAFQSDGNCNPGFCATAAGGGTWNTTRTGWTGGGGVEMMLSQLWSVRLEYRYTDLGTFTENVPIRTFCAGTCSSPSSNASINLHPTNNAVRVGLALNF